MLYMITKDGMFVPIRNQGDDYFYDIKFKFNVNCSMYLNHINY